MIQARLELAIECFRRPENKIEDVASHIGYSSAYYYSRLFTKEMGIPPSIYKKVV